MHLIQILLPLYDNDGKAFPQSHYAKVRSELTQKFGGITMFSRAPAQGLWKSGEEKEFQRDDIVVFEVMTDVMDRAWWGVYRGLLEELFRQESVVVRAQDIELL